MNRKEIVHCIATLIGVFFFVGSGYAQLSKFTGKWDIIIKKSNFGGIDAKVAAPKMITVEVSRDSVKVKRKFNEANLIIENLKIAEKDKEIYVDQNTLKIANVNLDSKNNSIEFKSSYEVDGAQFVYWRNEIWKMRGKFMEVERITVLKDRVERVTAIYKKVE